jgi:hypothetical protein
VVVEVLVGLDVLVVVVVVFTVVEGEDVEEVVCVVLEVVVVVVVGKLDVVLVVVFEDEELELSVEFVVMEPVELVNDVERLLVVVALLCPARSLTKYTPATEEIMMSPSKETTITTRREFS